MPDSSDARQAGFNTGLLFLEGKISFEEAQIMAENFKIEEKGWFFTTVTDLRADFMQGFARGSKK